MNDRRPIPAPGAQPPSTPVIDVDARLVGFDDAAVDEQVRVLTEIEESLRRALAAGAL